MAKVTAEMLKELANEQEEFDPFEWVEENFEDEKLCRGLLERVMFMSMLLPMPAESYFFNGLSIGMDLGKRLAQIEMLNERLE